MGKEIESPLRGQIVIQSDWVAGGESRKGYPKLVQILSGMYRDPVHNRVSNFWTWKELDTGAVVNGYGDFTEVQ